LLDPAWTKKTINLGAVNSPSCVVRFRATGDYGNDNIGVDSLEIKSGCTAPIVNAVSSASVICSGNNVNLNATGATTYSWSTGATTQSITVNPASTTVYTVTGSTSGCSASKTIAINVNPSPTVTTVSSASLICVGQSATLTASGANTYSWNTGSSANSIVVSPSVTTSYSVTGTNTVGCSKVTVVTQSVSTCTGIEALLTSSNGVSIFPNPNFGSINVVVSDISSGTSIEIFDAIGKLVISRSLIENQSIINTSELPKGIYMFTIKNMSGIIKQGKLIKE
jgi:hypothetical protein